MTARDMVICECFARDGLQHEPDFVPTATKIALIDAFSRAGFARVEATSYSHPGQVPAFADASDVLDGIARPSGVAFKATCPNPRAVDRALADLDAGAGADELSLLISATEAHTARNLRTTRADQWQRVAEMATAARGRARLVGVISMAWGCPFEGAVDPARVAEDAARFADLGAHLVTLGDTIGTATPSSVRALIARVRAAAPAVIPVGHFHDTRGTGLANCLAALDAGCTHLDSAMGGTGGHPADIVYGEGFTGNVVTEDLVNLLEEEGVSTGLDLDAVDAASSACETALGRPLRSMVARSGWGLSRRGEVARA
ncbi:hydroxymethylglutaryl-CoA lyase [Silicimonas algicola]|uniref:Hydroxymethylglutaryl-CoA lyase n=1 Tax=Silicimonas algicola TaxID=1826607 RepID=A0A316G3S3_9RHOB|nr:hydroxymethylglutaryl-CoA lyase [Silicimonas algicola]AZQ68287.1 hydroxymethylglutaryl-CoA lyase [Silicimonas algicola]PWK54576.1 hydroxymethylglutaryl-CoA lyase [Silicimonas algicola]